MRLVRPSMKKRFVEAAGAASEVHGKERGCFVAPRATKNSSTDSPFWLDKLQTGVGFAIRSPWDERPREAPRGQCVA